MTKKITMVCETCGSKNVMRDAFAEWDEETQTWVLRGDPYDQAYCDDCDGETSIEEVDVKEIQTTRDPKTGKWWFGDPDEHQFLAGDGGPYNTREQALVGAYEAEEASDAN